MKSKNTHQDYAHPEALVSTEWVKQHQADPKLRLLEVNHDALPGVARILRAKPLNWRRDLWNPEKRDLLGSKQFVALMERLGISANTAVVLYGDDHNLWAALALWVLSYHGHPHLKLMDGGLRKWQHEYRPTYFDHSGYAPSSYPLAQPNPHQRALKKDVLEQIKAIPKGKAVLLDVRSPNEFEGRSSIVPNPLEADVIFGGHIPQAIHIPWDQTLKLDRTFKSAAELGALYKASGVTPDKDIIVYCRLGERACHTWFVLSYLLGYERVRVYDGSWLEWSNSMGLAIAHRDPEPKGKA